MSITMDNMMSKLCRIIRSLSICSVFFSFNSFSCSYFSFIAMISSPCLILVIESKYV